ncbi:hypothetical protein [Mariniblastus fucicola]|uniref:Uncharacterized protein n=1 Tax=Mariniblastus fucicola TaxID=980251 RepID=A0A5B9PCM0_9BACT|nr:hypothetical protein [Mariniblastus fucicola]QEG23249.1 hypothetical protein MFFC18_31450 [Mariniblastus fucicola]
MPNSANESDIDPELDDLQESGLDESDVTELPPEKRGFGLWKWLKRIAIAAVLFVGLAAAAVFVLLELAKAEPEFYRKALQVDQDLQKQNGNEMETRILDLRNSVLVGDAWTATFTEDQINGWLAWDLENKFPGLIPPEITEPRLSVEDRSMTLAFRCNAKPFRGIAVIEADIFMTGVLNQVGIRVKSVRSGKIPVPLAAFADQISHQLKKSGLDIEWNTEEDDPVAIVQLPDALVKPEGGSYIEMQEIDIAKGKVSVSGVTHLPDY